MASREAGVVSSRSSQRAGCCLLPVNAATPLRSSVGRFAIARAVRGRRKRSRRPAECWGVLVLAARAPHLIDNASTTRSEVSERFAIAAARLHPRRARGWQMVEPQQTRVEALGAAGGWRASQALRGAQAHELSAKSQINCVDQLPSSINARRASSVPTEPGGTSSK